MKESLIQTAILHYLRGLETQGYPVYSLRNNSFAGLLRPRGGKFSHYVQTGRKGSPDIICLYAGRFIGLEIKSETGKQYDDQLQAQIAITKAGGEYYLVKSVLEVEKILAAAKS